MRLAWGRPEVFFGRNFDMECVSDQVRTGLGWKIWVVVDTLAEQSAARQQFEREGVNRPLDFNRRRRVGVIHAAGSSSITSKLAEVAAGQVRARCACALGAPHALASTRGSAAGSLGASRSRAPHVCGLEGGRTHHTDGSRVSFRVMDVQKGCAGLTGTNSVLRGG